MTDSRWSDDRFLDSLRQQGDPPADETIARLAGTKGAASIGAAFRMLRANDSPLPPDAPQPLRDFMALAPALPPGVDAARLQRGGDAFLRQAVPSVVVLLASSLPRGYAAPCLTHILSISRDLERHPYDRLMGVVQLLINISGSDAFGPHGRAIVTARKLRLLHAGVRALAARYRPEYRAAFGVPVNHEDMLATIMAFSYLLVEGIGRLGLPLAPDDAGDLYYIWRTFALLMGIHPEGQPHDDSYIPATLADAAVFYASYVRRNNTTADRNAYGVLLTRDNLAMMESLLPRSVRLLGGRYAPRLCMTELLAPDELSRVGYRPLRGHRILRALLRAVLAVGQEAGERLPLATLLARHVLQGLVDADRRGEVSFSVPFSRLDLRGPAFE